MSLCLVCGIAWSGLPRNRLAKYDHVCSPCRRRIYDAEWREARRAAGLPSSGSKTWDPQKRAEWKARYYSDPAVLAKNAERMRKYVRDPKLRDRHEARWQAGHAIATGRLVRQPCEVCGASRVDAHHPDYSKPLEVRWLCRACHRAEHARGHAKAEASR